MYALADEQLALQRLGRDFARQEVRPVAKELDGQADVARRYPWDVLDHASSLGLRTLALPQSEGGAGLDVLTHCLVFEELAYGDIGFATTLEQSWRLSTLLVSNKGTQNTLLPLFRDDGRLLLALVANDGQGARPVVARREGRDWRLEGEGSGVIAGGVARLFLVGAEVEAGQTSLFAVRSDTPGFQVLRLVDKLGRRLEPTADVELAGCVVGPEALVGEGGQGAAILARLGERYAGVTAIGGVAVAHAAYDLAVDWANRRVQGGKVIIKHPAIAGKVADMYVSLEAARSLALRAAWAADREPALVGTLGRAAKLLSADAAQRVCYDAMQIWGGMGYMREGGLEKFTRDAAAYYTEGEIDVIREQLGWIAAGELAGR